MSTTTFLTNKALWKLLPAKVKTARKVDAAVAYLGQGGADLLPLRRGHRLVVDMSRATVQAGTTDPREVEKLLLRGVRVFSRQRLHAKVVVADNSVFAGSANISKNSAKLDEAAMPWSRFRRIANRLLHRSPKAPPRTAPVPEIEAADRLLTMWSPRGRVATR